MLRSEAGGRAARRALALILLEPMFLVACGSAPGPAAPTPVVSRAFLHALSLEPGGSTLLTFDVDPSAGFLVLRSMRPGGTARLLAADPAGRFLYTASHRTVDDDGRLANSFASYAIDAESGSLAPRSDTGPTFPPGEWGGNPTSLAASRQHLHVALDRNNAYQSVMGLYAAITVDSASGALLPPPAVVLKAYDMKWVVAEPMGRFVYVGVESTVFSLDASAAPRVVGADEVPTNFGFHGAAVLAAGFLLVTDDAGGITSFAANPATGLLSRRSQLSTAFAERTTPRMAATTGIVALSASTQVQTLALNRSGELTLGDTMSFPTEPSYVQAYLAFHPSGRFLYVSRSGEGIYVFAVGLDGRLQAGGGVSQGGGPIVVTVPAG